MDTRPKNESAAKSELSGEPTGGNDRHFETPCKSREITWDTTTEEYFTFMGYVFDVREAKRVIVSKPRETHKLNVENARDVIGEPGGRRLSVVSLDWNAALSDEVDLNVPVIVVRFDDTYVVIDGYRRMAKACCQGLPSVPCVVLSEEESEAVCDRPLPRRQGEKKNRRRSR